MKKVVHMTSVHAPNDDRIVHKECVSLSNAGYDVSLVYLGECREIVDNRLHYVCAGAKPGGRLMRMVGGVWSVFWTALRLHADLYHFHDPELIPAGIVLKLFGKKVIYDVHEDVPKQILSKEWIPVRMRRCVSAIVSVAERIALRFMDGVVVVHEDLLNRIQKYHKNVVTVHNYPIYLLDSIPEKRIHEFVWLGGLGAIRGASELNEAFHDAGILHIIGSVEDETVFTKNDRIILEGSFPMREAQEKASRYFCGIVTFLPFPNHTHALPIKMFEYMSLGMAVIASDFPLWRAIIEKVRCGVLVDPQRPDDIAKAIRWLMENPDEAANMGRRGWEAVNKKYNWMHEEKVLLDFYHEKLS